jgi:hypothetical protein
LAELVSELVARQFQTLTEPGRPRPDFAVFRERQPPQVMAEDLRQGRQDAKTAKKRTALSLLQSVEIGLQAE